MSSSQEHRDIDLLLARGPRACLGSSGRFDKVLVGPRLVDLSHPNQDGAIFSFCIKTCEGLRDRRLQREVVCRRRLWEGTGSWMLVVIQQRHLPRFHLRLSLCTPVRHTALWRVSGRVVLHFDESVCSLWVAVVLSEHDKPAQPLTCFLVFRCF